MEQRITIIGGGLAGSEAALVLARSGVRVELYEMRPHVDTGVHKTDGFAELVCSNSFKGTRPDSAAGMLKGELERLGSPLYRLAQETQIPAGGALAVDRERFSQAVTSSIESEDLICVHREEVVSLTDAVEHSDAIILATGPLTSERLSAEIEKLIGTEELAFFDAAAPIVMADSLDESVVFRQSRYEDAGGGDYLNAPMTKEEYTAFIEALLGAQRVVAKDFETRDLFQACQPIEEVARAGFDAPRFGAMKPVGLTDPRTGKRPYAAVQLRMEDAEGVSFNLVGFQTNLTFPEQRRVFRMIPGLEHAEFARYGVMHRNTFLNAPQILDVSGRVRVQDVTTGGAPLYVVGQLSGTEGYTEAIRSGFHGAISVLARLKGLEPPSLSPETVFGALMMHATNPATKDYQPMHVNFGVMPPLDSPVKNKRERYRAFAERGNAALEEYVSKLAELGIWSGA